MSTYFLETIIAIILFILFKNSFLIATILFLLSLVTSYGIEWAKKAVKYDYVWEKFENKVLNIN